MRDRIDARKEECRKGGMHGICSRTGGTHDRRYVHCTVGVDG